MEDGNPASNDQNYLPDFDALHAASVYDEYLPNKPNMGSFDRSPEWHNVMFPPSSTNLLHPEQSLVPEEQALETDIGFFFSPLTSQYDYSTWTHGRTSNGAQEPVSIVIPQSITTSTYSKAKIIQASANMITDNSFYSQDSIFPAHKDCLFEDVYRNFPGPSAVVDMPAYDRFPLGTTCYTSALSFLPGSNHFYTKDHGSVSQETYDGDSDLCMTHAARADYGWSRLQDHTPDSWSQSIGLNLPPDTEPCFPSPLSPLLTQPTNSASSSSPTQPMAWQIANSAPIPQPLAQGNALSSKRKRNVPNDIDQELMLRGWEQRVSKRANIPRSSVNIVSFEGEEKFRVVRERRTKSEKESMRELALLGGSCTRCEHAKKRVRFPVSQNVAKMADES